MMATHKKTRKFRISTYFLKEIPHEWQEKRLSFLAQNKKNSFVDGPFGSDLKNSDYKQNGIPLIQLNNIRDGLHLMNNMKFISENKRNELQRHVAKNGDIVIAKMADPVARAAPVSNTYAEYVIVADCIKLSPNSSLINNNFLIWAINSFDVNFNAELVSTGTTRIRISLRDLKQLKIPYPCLNEQTQIANFLDYETQKIDTLISKQEQLIELLQEKRQAVISHAVTKGLDPNAKMKDSGVEWLGEIPEGWEVTKLKWKAHTTSGSTPQTSKYELYYQNGSFPWIRTTDLNNNNLYDAPIKITGKALQETACSILPENTVLIAMYGGAGSIGKHALLKFKSTINQAVCGILPNKNFNNAYLHKYYELYRPFWMVNAVGTRKDPNISQEHINESLVIAPPRKEQTQIADYLDTQTAKIDTLIDKAKQAIDLLQERRTALISAAVTGKIDVRDWQAPQNTWRSEHE